MKGWINYITGSTKNTASVGPAAHTLWETGSGWT